MFTKVLDISPKVFKKHRATVMNLLHDLLVGDD